MFTFLFDFRFRSITSQVIIKTKLINITKRNFSDTPFSLQRNRWQRAPSLLSQDNFRQPYLTHIHARTCIYIHTRAQAHVLFTYTRTHARTFFSHTRAHLFTRAHTHVLFTHAHTHVLTFFSHARAHTRSFHTCAHARTPFPTRARSFHTRTHTFFSHARPHTFFSHTRTRTHARSFHTRAHTRSFHTRAHARTHVLFTRAHTHVLFTACVHTRSSPHARTLARGNSVTIFDF